MKEVVEHSMSLFARLRNVFGKEATYEVGSIEELEHRLKKLPETFPDIKARLGLDEGDCKLTHKDPFHLEPFYFELKNLPVSLGDFVEFDHALSDNKSTGQLFSYYMRDNAVYCKTEQIGQNGTQFTLYEKDGLTEYAYSAMTDDVSSNDFYAVSVSALEKNTDGKLVSFKRARYSHMNRVYLSERDYSYDADVITCEDKSRYSDEKMASESTYLIELSGDHVQRIRIVRGASQPEVLYDKALHDLTDDALSEKIVETLVREISTQMNEKVVFDEKVECVVLEFSAESYFPPNIGIATTDELGYSCGDDYFLNTYSMYHNSSDGTVDVDLEECEGNDYFALFNSRFNMSKNADARSDYSHKMAVDIYSEVRQRLNRESFDKSFPDRVDTFSIRSLGKKMDI